MRRGGSAAGRTSQQLLAPKRPIVRPGIGVQGAGARMLVGLDTGAPSEKQCPAATASSAPSAQPEAKEVKRKPQPRKPGSDDFRTASEMLEDDDARPPKRHKLPKTETVTRSVPPACQPQVSHQPPMASAVSGSRPRERPPPPWTTFDRVTADGRTHDVKVFCIFARIPFLTCPILAARNHPTEETTQT